MRILSHIKKIQLYPGNRDFYTLVIEGKAEERGSIFYSTILVALIKPDKSLILWTHSYQDWQRLENFPMALFNISFLSPSDNLIFKFFINSCSHS